MLPAMVCTLERALKGISTNNVRRIPQIERYASFDYICAKLLID